MFVARDKDNTLYLYIGPTAPTKSGSPKDDIWHCDANCEFIKIDNSLFPELKWENDPIEVSIVPSMIDKVQTKLAESVDDYFDYVSHVQDIHPYSKEKEQKYYDNMCWRWQDWNSVKYDHPSTWDLNFYDYKKQENNTTSIPDKSNPIKFESCGNHLRNLLTPYQCLIDIIQNYLDGNIAVGDIKDFLKDKNLQEEINNIIEFSKSDKLENINWR